MADLSINYGREQVSVAILTNIVFHIFTNNNNNSLVFSYVHTNDFILKVVDFSMPFLELGVSILFVNAPEKSVNLFAFLLPLSRGVWLLMIFAGFAVSVVMYGIAR